MKKLLPEGLLPEPLAAGIARAFNAKTNKVVTTPSGAKVDNLLAIHARYLSFVVYKVPLSVAGEIDPTHYVDPKSGHSFALDHLALKTVEDSSPSNQDMSLEDKRSALQAVLDVYVAGRFVTEEAAGGVYARDGKIVAVVSGERPNLRNFWSGRWGSTWTIQCTDGQATVVGEIKVRTNQ